MKTNAVKKILAFILTSILLAGMMPVHSFANAVTLSGSEEDGYYFNIPNIVNLMTLDLTQKPCNFSFKLYDDGGKDGYYSTNCSSTLVLTAAEGCIFQITGSGRTESTSYDYLTLYDGDTSTVLGNDRYGGSSFTTGELTTTGNVLKVRFTSDYSVNDDGFELTVTIVDPASLATVTYMFGEQSHTISYVIGSTITLPAFTSLFTLPDRTVFTGWQCEGTPYAATDAFTVTGNTVFTAITEEEPVISYDELNDLYYSNMPKSSALTADLTDKEAGFVLRVYDNGGVNGNYTSNCNGSLTVIVKEGYVIRVGADIVTESSYDYFYIYNGDAVDDANLYGRYTGSTSVRMYTQGSAVTLRFTSDGGTEIRGIDATVTVTDPATLATVSFDPGAGSGSMDSILAVPGEQIALPVCGFTLPEKTFFDQYSDGTNTYSANSLYTVTESVVLTALYVEKMYITYESGEDTQVYEVRKDNLHTVRQYGNTFSDLPYRCAFLNWTSGGEDYAAGDLVVISEDISFTAVFEQLPILIEDDTIGAHALLPKTGEESLDLSDKQSGYTLKIFDNNGPDNYYSNKCDGALVITAPQGYILTVGGPVSTEYYSCDYVMFYDADLETVLGSGVYGDGRYGGNCTVPNLQTTGNKLKIRFVSDNSSYDEGFELTVKLIDPANAVTVSFDPGDGSGSMSSIVAVRGESITLPACTFSAPYDENWNQLAFARYTNGTNEYYPGDVITPTSDLTLTAVYAQRVQITYQYYNDGSTYTRSAYAANGAVIRLPEFTQFWSMPAKYNFTGWEESASGDVYAVNDPYTLTGDTVFTAKFELIPVLLEDGEGGYFACMPSGYDTDTIDITDKAVGFSFMVYDDGGKDGNYSTSSLSYLIIKAPAGAILKAEGRISTEHKNYDYLCFYDGLDSACELLGEGAYGSQSYRGGYYTFDPVFSSGSAMTLCFHSDSYTVAEGFELTVTVIEPVTVSYLFEEESKSLTFEKNSEISLAEFEDLFDLPYGKEFVCWTLGEERFDEGDTIYVSEDTVISAVLALMPTVTVDGNGALLIDGSGQSVSAALPMNKGTTFEIPHARDYFFIPEGKVFGGWTVNGVTYAVGDSYTLTEDIVATAVWLDPSPWDLMVETLNADYGTDLGTIVLTSDLIASNGSNILYLPKGVAATVDLAGHRIDGSAVAPISQGVMFVVKGALTIIDSTGGGSITGGGVTVLETATLNLPAALSARFAAKLDASYICYYYEGNERKNQTGVYAYTYFETLYDALKAAYYEYDFQDDVEDLPEGYDDFFYNDPTVTLLADASLPAGETWTVNSTATIWLDLGGCTFTVAGTLNGKGPYFDNRIDDYYHTRINVDSPVPGVMRISGVLDVDLQPWSCDTYYITGGEINDFFADAGVFYISGGRIANGYFNNGNRNAPLSVYLSGDAELENVGFVVYSDAEMQDLVVTVNGGVRFTDVSFRMGEDGSGALSGNKPVMTVNGGYFDENPALWKRGLVVVPYAEVDQNNLSQYVVARWNSDRTPYDELDDYYKEHLESYTIYEYSDSCYEEFVLFASAPEQYSGQSDWAYDGGVFAWRVSGAASGPSFDLDKDGDASVTDVTALLNYIAGVGSEDYSVAGDFNRDSSVDVNDVTALLNYIAGVGGVYAD